MRRGDGQPGPEGPQPAAVHPAGAEGRPPREERAQGQSVHAAGGAGLLQKVFTGTFISICAGVFLIMAKLLIFMMVCFSATRQKMKQLLPVRLPHRNRGLALDLQCSQSQESNACTLSPHIHPFSHTMTPWRHMLSYFFFEPVHDGINIHSG